MSKIPSDEIDESDDDELLANKINVKTRDSKEAPFLLPPYCTKTVENI
ncbi:hypothetical protein [Nitrosomonas sp.]|nr:hypothetical protein [Nitrosomonas sp.]